MASKELTDLSISMANQPKETLTPTSAGMETATQTVERIKGALTNPINASNVPASMVDGNVPSVQMPPDMSLPADMGVVGAGEQTANTLQEQYTRQAEEKVAQSGQAVGQNERGILEAFGILQQEPEDRRQLEESEGVNAFSDAMRTQNETLRMQLAELREFDRNNVNTIEQMRVDASKRDITKRTFSAMSAEATIQNAVQRANKAADVYASIASIDVMQGNFDRATKRVDQALNTKYEPVRQQLELEKFFLERNDKRFTSAQSELAGLRLKEIDREQAQMDRAIGLSDSAVASGYASSEDIQELIDLSSSPEKQAAYAVQILGKGARAAVQLENAIKNRQHELLGLEIQSEQTKLLEATQATEDGVLTPEQFTVANDLRKEVNGMQEVKDAKDLEANTASLIAALEQETGVGDISAINSFQRLVVDPGVAVREGDVALLQSAMSFTDEARLRAQGLIKGDKLTPQARQQMRDLVEEVYRIRVELVDRNTSQVRTIANEQGIDYGKYIGNTFKTFDQLQASVTNAPAVTFGGPQPTNDYLDNITSALLSDPQSNPFGVTF